MQATKGVIAVIAAVVFVIVVSIAAWQLHWFVAEKNVNRQAHINQDSYQRQNALVEGILDDIKDAETPNIPPQQRAAIVSQICDSASKLTGSITLNQHTVTFIAQECPA